MNNSFPTKYSLGSVVSALIGSWGGIAALAYALLGGGAILATCLVTYREWLGPFRGLFFHIALILVGRSHIYIVKGMGDPGGSQRGPCGSRLPGRG